MNPTRQPLFLNLLLNLFGPLGAVCPHGACRVVRLNTPQGPDCRGRPRPSPDNAVSACVPMVDVEVVLVAIMALVVFLRPMRIRVLLPTLGRLVSPQASDGV